MMKVTKTITQATDTLSSSDALSSLGHCRYRCSADFDYSDLSLDSSDVVERDGGTFHVIDNCVNPYRFTIVGQ